MLSPEDKKDVKGAYGKAIANKISKVTKDSNHKGIELARKANAAQSPLELRRLSAQYKEDSRVRKLPVTSHSIGTYVAKRGPTQDNGFKPEKKMKMDKVPYWGKEDYKQANEQTYRRLNQK